MTTPGRVAAPLNAQQRFLLGECVEAYLPLDEAQKREFERPVTTPGYQGVAAMNMTSFEKGQEQERRALLRELLEERFGPVSPEVLRRLDELPAERLQPVRKAAWKAASLAELGLA